MLAWTTGSEGPRTRSIHTAFVLHRCPTIGMSGDPATWIRALPEPLQSSVFLYFWHLLWIDTKQVCVGSHIGSRSRTSPSLDLCMLPESEPAINSCAHSRSCLSSNTHLCSCYTSSPWFLILNLNRVTVTFTFMFGLSFGNICNASWTWTCSSHSRLSV